MRPTPNTPTELYLDLLKSCLTRYIFIDEQPSLWGYTKEHIEGLRLKGGDWPPSAETMIGILRLDNIQECIRSIIYDNIPGDLIETGIWRGGAVIFMRAALKAWGDTTRSVWCADSFQGVPRPNEKDYPSDIGNQLWTASNILGIDIETVKRNFKKYGLLDERVKFLPGWFKDTLPGPINQLSLIRLDGDLYESTIQVLDTLYPKLSPGGYVIVDDYALVPCRQAIDDYRCKNNIIDQVIPIDEMSAFWRKH